MYFYISLLIIYALLKNNFIMNDFQFIMQTADLAYITQFH